MTFRMNDSRSAPAQPAPARSAPARTSRARAGASVAGVLAVTGVACVLAMVTLAEAKTRKAGKAALPAVEIMTDIVAEGGAKIGTARLRQGPAGVLIGLEFQAGTVSPGWHGVHFHEKAECSDAGFKLSGAHVGHAGTPGRHGLLNPAGPETGDLPNIEAPAAGSFGAELFSPFVVLGAQGIDGRAPLLDADGSALVIHAARDDHQAQPIGNAGGRIACAVLRPAPAP